MDSILTSIKKLLGIEEDYTHFDQDIIIYINSAFMGLHQLGVGPEEGFEITDATDEWDDFVSGRTDLGGIKTYVYLKVRLIFDPPQAGYVITAIQDQIKELEWRLNVQVEGVVI